MNWLRKVLFPFAILYGLITSIRNFLYDVGLLKAYSFDIPVIAVGNLSVGGTGKTPQIEYLIRLLSPQYKIATLSRGYKRQSKGFVLADAKSNAASLGDEPFQYYKKFPLIQVAVDADRRNGITQLGAQKNKPEVILLDDAFQHRKVKAGFYILLTAYDDLFCDDYILPVGSLREGRRGAKRADMIIVTKCPPTISQIAQRTIKNKIGLDIPLFFSCIAYDDAIYNDAHSMSVAESKSKERLLLAGIAKPRPFFSFMGAKKENTMVFPDHHHFTDSDIDTIKTKAGNSIIITTEKDFVRLQTDVLKEQLYYLPIKSQLITNQEAFDQTILNYVGTCTGNR
ncbi:MAG: Tetraacyldisaccharide 4-kinase [Bacteroidota bacterium]|jgi:tetraacyldisaccharide 4'-kinase